MELKPIVPFEPVRAEQAPTGPNWVAQIKWDGVRMLAYGDGPETRLWNRRGNERTMQYPEFADVRRYCNASSVILDGEMIALDSAGKPSFHEIMKRDRLRTESKIAQAISRVPVTYMIFDVVYCNGEWATGMPLGERQRLLERIVVPGERVQLVRNVTDPNALLGVMRSHRMEGIVCKDLTSGYALDGKDDRWRKIKLFRDMYAVVGGVTYRDKLVNALLLGLYDPGGTLYYIGHAGTGKLTQADWRRLTERVQPMRIGDRPFANVPERNKDAVWIRPELVVKVQFLEWTPDGIMRHPSIQTFAEGADPVQVCTFGQD
ncbi:RNA ligase family protein [Paenibacillus flagellatus]|uniref:DNA ligase (ATP) n=1 Tax=Paenibacillus flagellatus TaxID=2211139 RepID=A0A2V5KP50_9BACL|nr:RNA ligase family protein [Paenibacillus flagellatus]PYI52907.1 DNA ligase [Paenibacillus flagellatus]